MTSNLIYEAEYKKNGEPYDSPFQSRRGGRKPVRHRQRGRGVPCSTPPSCLHVVGTLAMFGDVEAFALLLLRHAQADHDINQLEQDGGEDA